MQDPRAASRSPTRRCSIRFVACVFNVGFLDPRNYNLCLGSITHRVLCRTLARHGASFISSINKIRRLKRRFSAMFTHHNVSAHHGSYLSLSVLDLYSPKTAVPTLSGDQHPLQWANRACLIAQELSFRLTVHGFFRHSA